LSHIWSTDFPLKTDVGFIPADINPSILLSPVIERLPIPVLEKLVNENEDLAVRKIANDRLELLPGKSLIN
jgi:hypothetical protein